MRTALALALLFCFWGGTLGCSEDRVIQPAGDSDGAVVADPPDAGPTVDGGGAVACDMNGRFIQVEITHSQALGATQTTRNWFYHEVAQAPDGSFTITKSLNCGIRVTGTTTVTLPDATTEALALKTSYSTGRKGFFRPTADGRCEWSLDRIYNLRGAKSAEFLDDIWKVGDPPKDLSEFPPLPANAAEGMDDWDADGKEGITLQTGLGDRYVAQRDWNQEHGFVAQNLDKFGGDGMIVTTWDGQEKVSTQTSPLLQTTSTPMSPGFSYWERVGERLVVVTTGAHPELETCKHAVALALTDFPEP
jgi:hypothetical protein